MIDVFVPGGSGVLSTMSLVLSGTLMMTLTKELPDKPCKYCFSISMATMNSDYTKFLSFLIR